MTYTFTRSGRSLPTALILLAIWLVVLWAVIVIALAWWIAAAVLVFTLPAIWDLVSNRQSHIGLDDTGLYWQSGKHGGTIPLRDIAKVRIDRRLDLSYRIAAVMVDGRKRRLPPDTQPPVDEFEAALNAKGIKTERNPFSLLGV
ncbi:hypothetical protein FTO60_05495 [Octadecabacter sp. SW4]|uniref:hypothetical protein n=1 Tax=Octadecabacter sp. SW4 TaxID=2602067 RepID=UPI0011C1DCC7|nr:hypothetical protein [Octadecabacter sp. SW4]QEE35214.1 hypothetical protein FTO60_05495 [Octadecabacter sp. SW4]